MATRVTFRCCSGAPKDCAAGRNDGLLRLEPKPNPQPDRQGRRCTPAFTAVAYGRGGADRYRSQRAEGHFQVLGERRPRLLQRCYSLAPVHTCVMRAIRPAGVRQERFQPVNQQTPPATRLNHRGALPATAGRAAEPKSSENRPLRAALSHTRVRGGSRIPASTY